VNHGEPVNHGHPASIRPYQPADLADLYRICLLTADSGGDGTALFHDPRLPGDLFAAPYGIFQPSLAFVATDAEGVGGYVLGALDSVEFEDRLARDWLPTLRERYPEPGPAGDRWARERQFTEIVHHRHPLPASLAERYPSHLHIDLLPRLQGRGLGRQLVGRLTAALREQGSPGVHLLVGLSNQRAPGFYAHVGFTELPPGISGVRTFVMDLRAPAPAPS